MHGAFGQFAVLLLGLSAAAALSLSVRLPVVPLYIIAGLALRATGLVDPSDEVEFLGSLGVVFLLFSMGLEFSVGSVAIRPLRFVGGGRWRPRAEQERCGESKSDLLARHGHDLPVTLGQAGQCRQDLWNILSILLG